MSGVHPLSAQRGQDAFSERVGADKSHPLDAPASSGEVNGDVGFGSGDRCLQEARGSQPARLRGHDRDHRFSNRDDIWATFGRIRSYNSAHMASIDTIFTKES